ncbi:MAG: hypothetical protein ACJA1L_001874 [Paracoccaceae bacterium]|jgi:hypothetical protein
MTPAQIPPGAAKRLRDTIAKRALPRGRGGRA